MALCIEAADPWTGIHAFGIDACQCGETIGVAGAFGPTGYVRVTLVVGQTRTRASSVLLAADCV